MLNSCRNVRLVHILTCLGTNLLDRHHNLDRVQTVQTEIIREVGSRCELIDVRFDRRDEHSTVVVLPLTDP